VPFYQFLYRLLTDRKSDDSGSRETAGNFSRLLLARLCSKVGDRLASPKTTLAWLLQTLGAPAIFIGFLVPLRESGSLLPQVVLSNYLKRFRFRKWAWSLGAVVQGLAIAGCALAALTLTGTAAGFAIVGLIAVFALARGVSSVSAKDVLGKTIPKSKRGQLTGWAGSVSGVITLTAAGFLLFVEGGEASVQTYAVYLALAAVLWWVASFVNARVVEPEGEVEEKKSLWEGLGSQLSLLKEDKTFRNFLIVRAFALGSGLSTPYLISLAYGRLGGASFWLGIFIAVDGLAATVASPFWGRWADRSSRRVLRTAMLGVAILLSAVIAFVLTVEESTVDQYVFPFALFLLAAAHAGVRVGRKTYVVDMAEGNQRTDYVSTGNTLIGVLLLVAGLFTGAISLISVELALGIFAALALVGAGYGRQLPAVSQAE